MGFVTPLIKWDCPPVTSRRPRTLVSADIGKVLTVLLRKKSLFYNYIYRPACLVLL